MEIFSPCEEPSFRKLVQEFAPKLIIAGPLGQAVSSIPKDINLPIIGMSHAYDVNYPQEDMNIKSNIQRCSMIITDCMTIKDKIINDFSFMGHTAILPYGCDYAFFSQTKLTFESKLKILVTRNWTDIHRNILILETLARLSKKGLDFHCDFVGSGPMLGAGKNYARKNLKQTQYTFHGARTQEEIAKLMATNWIYISASESDGTSVSLLESMSAGLICLASSFPSNLEWINHGETGFIFKNGDINDMEIQLSEIAQLPRSSLVKISSQSKQRVSVSGNWETNKAILLRTISTFLNENYKETSK
jgi:glycosyltransferase involved in cell wall biosynthesis